MLPPTFAIDPIEKWRSTRRGLEAAVDEKLQFSLSLTEKHEDFFTPGLSQEARITALDKFKTFVLDKAEADQLLKWNTSLIHVDQEICFRIVQGAIKGIDDLSPSQIIFLLNLVVSCFHYPKDRLKIFGVSLADVHPMSDSFSESTAWLWIGERLKQPALKLSIPMPWSQRVQFALFWATALTLVITMSNMFVLSPASPWRLVLENRSALILRASMILPTVSVLLRATLWVVQSRDMTGRGNGSRVGPFDCVRSVACGVVITVLLLGAAPQLVPILPLILSLGCVWATMHTSVPVRCGYSACPSQ